jgi:3-phenylpropionate/trans-cinnamate dioxygenase ferredoxin subunit
MTTFVKVGRASDLPPGSRTLVEVGEDAVIVLNVDGEYLAIADLCTHDGGPLEDGDIVDGCIECPRHGALFDLRTGKVKRLPATDPIPVFQVRVEDDDLYVAAADDW